MADRRSNSVQGTKSIAESPVSLSAMALALLAGTTSAMAQFGQVPGQQPENEGEAMRDPLAGGAVENDDAKGVVVDENNLVDIHVQNEDLTKVLRTLSLMSQRNLVVSPQVSGTVTTSMYGVTFYEALDALLNVNGYGYVERGNFIEVYPIEYIKKIIEENRPKVTQIVNLNYLEAVAAAEFVKPLLSENGEIKTNGDAGSFTLGDGPSGGESFAHSATMVIYDYQENVDAIVEMVGQLDTKPQQVLVEATILQTSLTENNEFGVDFTILGSLDPTAFINGLSPVQALKDGIGSKLVGTSATSVPLPGGGFGNATESTVGNTSGPGGFKFGIVAGEASLFLKLLAEVGDTTILSRPKLLTLNRQPARVLVGRKVGYLQTTSTDTSTTQSVEFLDTGTQLTLRPFVAKDGSIRMELKPAVSEAVIRNTQDATGAAVTIPDEITNEMNLNIQTRDGQTIVLGGLFRESTSADRRQVPFLGDLPIVGYAFRGMEDETTRNEIIFMIKTSLVNDQVLIEQGARGEEYVKHVRSGARDQLLPWSREKQSAQLLIDAQRLAREGNYKEALYTVRRSLALNPAQADAIALRERLVNNKTEWPHRSMLQEIVHGETETLMNQLPSDVPSLVAAQELAEKQAKENAKNGGKNAPAPQKAGPSSGEEPTYANVVEGPLSAAPSNSTPPVGANPNASDPDAEPLTIEELGKAVGALALAEESTTAAEAQANLTPLANNVEALANAEQNTPVVTPAPEPERIAITPSPVKPVEPEANMVPLANAMVELSVAEQMGEQITAAQLNEEPRNVAPTPSPSFAPVTSGEETVAFSNSSTGFAENPGEVEEPTATEFAATLARSNEVPSPALGGANATPSPVAARPANQAPRSTASVAPGSSRIDFGKLMQAQGPSDEHMSQLFDLVVSKAVWGSPVAALTMNTPGHRSGNAGDGPATP